MPEYSIISVLAAGCICLITCSAVSWTSPVIPKLKTILPTLSITDESWLGSLVPLGAVFGSYFFGYLADKVGRKYCILCISLPVTAAYVLILFYKKLLVLYISRFIAGCSMGGSFAVLPVYIGEVSSAKYRGILGATMTVYVTGGIFLSYVLGPFVSLDMFNLVLAILPLMFFVIFLIVGVESPYYYVSKNNLETAQKTLKTIRNASSLEIKDELSDIIFLTQKARNAKLWHIFQSKPLFKAEIICASLVFFHQGSGSNALVSFTEQIFSETGTSLSPEISSLICGALLWLSTFVATFLIHRFNRRPLLIVSISGIIFSLGLISIYLCLKERQIYSDKFAFIPPLCLTLYLVTFNLGLGPLVFVAQGEFFPTDLRASAGAFNSGLCWLISFLVTQYFKQIANIIGLGETFFIFTGVSVSALVFCIWCLIETKDKSLKEIQDELTK